MEEPTQAPRRAAIAIDVIVILASGLCLNIFVRGGLFVWLLLLSMWVNLIEFTYKLYYQPNYSNDEK
jgi:hypothetical protein